MTHLSRRDSFRAAAGLLIGVALSPPARAQAPAGSGAAAILRGTGAAPVLAPNAFVRVGADDMVTVIVKHIEFGQGPFTGLATLVAEEMDADWSRIRAEHAPADVTKYANALMGVQGTGGSTAIASSFEPMRKAGATARAMLLRAASEAWGLPQDALTVERGVIRHAASNRQGRFGEFAEAASRLPVPENVPLKDPAAYRLIGKEGTGTPRRLDSAAKTDGSATFTMDVHEPGMLTVLVAHPPRFGATVATLDDSAALRVLGVVAVRRIPSGIAVYGQGFWAARQGREALRITWDESRAERRGSEDLIQEYRTLARATGRVVGEHGDVEAALARGGQVVEAEYVFPFLTHAPMEPLDGFMRWDGTRAQARFGSQVQTLDQGAIAAVFGIPMENVAIETLLAGGSFGRRAQTTAHLAAELAECAKAIGPGRPVKLVWTREDDIRGGYYRSLMLHRMRGTVRDGRIEAWTDTVVGQSIIKGSPFESVLMPEGYDPTSVEGSQEIPYAVPNFRCDLHTTDTGVPVLWWRSVGHTHTGYAVETFVDQLLELAGKDPVAGRLEMMDRVPRAAGVLRAVAQLAGWNGPGPHGDRARGVAVVESFGTFVAQIAEVSRGDAADGPRVHKVWCAVDCGVAVNPDVIRAQMEGGIGFGLGHALYAEVPLVEGRVVPSNFDEYRSLRINEMPEIEVTIVESREPPTGVGEPSVPPIAPAVANALARLTGERQRRLPFVRAGVA
ncbi:molybdopterin cofactor-binding domain-containing protein [Roseomonas sp. CCTCC AB2023176]|uniref:xanthine dehydrogenase family protein molybdopterin-binding subunit n=1 Tax=Roseomonas sp. CCTCC AB2023176 TaxID=3342640 RepID=UPI0035DF0255